MKPKQEAAEFEEQVIKNLLPLYEQLDAHALKMVKGSAEEGRPVSCKKGCTYCCYQMTVIMFAEGIVIAKEIFGGERHWKSIARELKEASKKCHGPELTRGGYFAQQIPCPLLDQEKKECTIYNVRPAACRYLYAVSPAEDCSIENKGKTVLGLNMTKLEAAVWEFSAIASGGQMVSAPLPIMVLFCMQAIAPGKKAEKHLKGLCMGMPDPMEWMIETAKNEALLAEETPDTVEAVRDAVRSFGDTFTLEEEEAR